MEFINQYDVTVFHKPGKSPEMSMADYLSRVVTAGLSSVSKSHELDEDRGTRPRCLVVKNEMSVVRIQEAQSQCPVISDLIINNGDRALDKSVTGMFDQHVIERLFVDSRDLSMVKFNGGRHTSTQCFGVKDKSRIVVPESLIEEVLAVCHSGGLACLMGQDRTWKRARDSFYWKNMKQDVDRFVDEHENCGRNKHSTRPNIAPYQETDLPHVPLEHLQVDFAGPFKAA